jgi:curved DNA-binding protein CbpA
MSTSRPSDALYRVLELEPGASLADMKKNLRRLRLQHHPDKGGDGEKFSALQEAYDILSDEKKRAEYDKSSGNVSHAPKAQHTQLSTEDRQIIFDMLETDQKELDTYFEINTHFLNPLGITTLDEPLRSLQAQWKALDDSIQEGEVSLDLNAYRTELRKIRGEDVRAAFTKALEKIDDPTRSQLRKQFEDVVQPVLLSRRSIRHTFAEQNAKELIVEREIEYAEKKEAWVAAQKHYNENRPASELRQKAAADAKKEYDDALAKEPGLQKKSSEVEREIHVKRDRYLRGQKQLDPDNAIKNDLDAAEKKYQEARNKHEKAVKMTSRQKQDAAYDRLNKDIKAQCRVFSNIVSMAHKVQEQKKIIDKINDPAQRRHLQEKWEKNIHTLFQQSLLLREGHSFVRAHRDAFINKILMRQNLLANKITEAQDRQKSVNSADSEKLEQNKKDLRAVRRELAQASNLLSNPKLAFVAAAESMQETFQQQYESFETELKKVLDQEQKQKETPAGATAQPIVSSRPAPSTPTPSVDFLIVLRKIHEWDSEVYKGCVMEEMCKMKLQETKERYCFSGGVLRENLMTFLQVNELAFARELTGITKLSSAIVMNKVKVPEEKCVRFLEAMKRKYDALKQRIASVNAEAKQVMNEIKHILPSAEISFQRVDIEYPIKFSITALEATFALRLASKLRDQKIDYMVSAHKIEIEVARGEIPKLREVIEAVSIAAGREKLAVAAAVQLIENAAETGKKYVNESFATLVNATPSIIAKGITIQQKIIDELDNYLKSPRLITDPKKIKLATDFKTALEEKQKASAEEKKGVQDVKNDTKTAVPEVTSLSQTAATIQEMRSRFSNEKLRETGRLLKILDGAMKEIDNLNNHEGKANQDIKRVNNIIGVKVTPASSTKRCTH